MIAFSRLLGVVAALVAVGGCERSQTARIEIPFAATVEGRPFSCSGDADGAFVGRDLRVYVHDVELIDAEGRAARLQLDDDGVSQDGSVALLDFEDGTGSCRNGSAMTHTAIVGRAPEGDWRHLRFRIGVPFALNHADPAIADPPLNLGRMHWGWRAGYKFMRFEAEPEPGRRVSLHLGSTECVGTIGAIEACARPNRPTVEIEDFAGKRIVFDVGDLAAALVGETGDGMCMAEADDPDCLAVFPVLGLGPEGEATASPPFVRAVAAAPQG